MSEKDLSYEEIDHRLIGKIVRIEFKNGGTQVVWNSKTTEVVSIIEPGNNMKGLELRSGETIWALPKRKKMFSQELVDQAGAPTITLLGD